MAADKHRSRTPWPARVLGAGLVTAAAGALAGVSWAAGEVYRAVKEARGLAAVDQPVLDWVRGVRTPWLDAAVTAFTNLGGPEPQQVALGAVAVVLGWRWRSWVPPVLCVVAYAGADVLTRVGKGLFGRARPPLAAAVPPVPLDSSFPSGHTIFGVVVAGTIAHLVSRRATSRRLRVAAGATAVAWAVAMGLSRAYLGHHWATDVAFGWLLGCAWLAVVVAAHRWVTTRRRVAAQPRPAAPTTR